MREPQMPVYKPVAPPQPKVEKKLTSATNAQSGQSAKGSLNETEFRYKSEWENLLGRIKNSELLNKSPDRRTLLDYLWQCYPERASNRDLEVVLGNIAAPADMEGSRSRVSIGELRRRVKTYGLQFRDEKWLAAVSKGRGGYRLTFELAHKPQTASQAFWISHLRSFEEPILISGSHLFFSDRSNSRITRYYDFNMHGDYEDDEILAALISRHPEAATPPGVTSSIEPLRDTYLAAGDVCAYEALLSWFYKESELKILLRRTTSRQITMREVHRKNVILIGRPQTNPIIAKLMEFPALKSKIAFRIHALKGTLDMSIVKARDLPLLKGFPISGSGVVGPVSDKGKVFGIFTRFPNPGGRGSITIISCGHYAMVTARIVEAMTNETHAAELLRLMGKTLNEPLPDAFEILFTVELAPGGLDGEGSPQLVYWRSINVSD